MFIIASNITTRTRKVAEALQPPAESADAQARQGVERERAAFLGNLAKQCVAAGADALDVNLQQKRDRPEVMEFAVRAIQDAVDCQLCLSANRADTLEAGLRECKRPAIVNYVSMDERRLREILPVAAYYNAELVLLISDPVAPSMAEDAVKAAAVLVGAANEAGIPNDRLMLDPGVLHVTTEMGQRHSRMLLELLPALEETFEPAIRTACWISNVSAAAPRRLRPAIDNAFLATLGGLGLSAAFMDVLNKDTMRTRRLISVFRNEVIYADAEVERVT
ncbi:MAG: dihydropteroate synthase [Dehalococcoidia bacterium]|nr:dihydropteroate synthase [Dehalococcoidia bacterium]